MKIRVQGNLSDEILRRKVSEIIDIAANAVFGTMTEQERPRFYAAVLIPSWRTPSGYFEAGHGTNNTELRDQAHQSAGLQSKGRGDPHLIVSAVCDDRAREDELEQMIADGLVPLVVLSDEDVGEEQKVA